LKHGELATKLVTKLILGRDVILQTSKSGKYGRWIGDILLSGNSTTHFMLTDLLGDVGLHKLDSYAAYA
jgi:hypothetical protein